MLKNRDRRREYIREWSKKNLEKESAKKSAWVEKNRDHVRAYKREWSAKNKDRRNRVHRERMESDPLYALRIRVRNRINIAIRRHGYTKSSGTAQIIGCDWGTLESHLASQFQPGMTWSNRGEWHIDHVIPLDSAKTENELLELCHYTNLQPLWAKHNLSKGRKT